MAKGKRKVVREIVGGEVYEYVPLGKHIVSAKGVCGGRPTFKYTRVEVATVLRLIAAGVSVDELVANFKGRISRDAIEEALQWAAKLVAQQGKAVAA
ncbi:MAG: hypothetical protein KEFWMYNX_000636 [Candidatus Fervidibacter sp.]|jgi:uncharacterized protein (DUF433 family)